MKLPRKTVHVPGTMNTLSIRSATATCLAILSLSGPALAQGWDERALTTRPSARGDHATAIDPTSGELLLFGGVTNIPGSPSELGDTWLFDGCRWRQPAFDPSPSPRRSSAMAADTARDRVVLFGGSTGAGETWEWDGATWVQVQPVASPPPREKHAMAFDPQQGLVVLFGGEAAGTGRLSDTWVYDGTVWTQLVTTTTPNARNNHTLEFDGNLQQVLLFGGLGQSPTTTPQLGDTWRLDFNLPDGPDWRLVTASGPAPREDHAMVFDGAGLDQRMVLRGGTLGSGVLGDEWTFDGVTWTPSSPSSAPRARRAQSLDLGPRAELIVFGGFYDVPSASVYLDDTWTTPAMPAPDEQARPAIVDPAVQPCPAGGFTPRITSDTCPNLGSSFVVDVSGFDPSRPAAWISYGFTPVTAACPSLAHTTVASAVVQLDGNGAGSFGLFVPNDPSLAGLTLHFQALGFVGVPGSPDAIIVTNQAIAVVGS